MTRGSFYDHKQGGLVWSVAPAGWSKPKATPCIELLAVKLTHPILNYIFDIGVTFTVNYFFSRMRRSCR
jgi:hypothetical protein